MRSPAGHFPGNARSDETSAGHSSGSEQRPDAVVALAFGTGASNAVLAQAAKRLCRSFDAPLVCQKEIADHLIPSETETAPEILRDPDDARLDTYGALLQAKAISEQHGWNRILLVAHPDHAQRALKAARSLGFSADVAPVGEVPYDPNSRQWWTRNKLVFKAWDFAANPYYSVRALV